MATAEIVAIIALVITTLTSLPDMHDRSNDHPLPDPQARARPTPQVRPRRPHGKPWGRPITSLDHPKAEPGVWARAGGPAPTHRGNQEGTR